MDLQTFVRKTYVGEIRARTDLPEDFRAALLRVDRTEKFLNNIMEQVVISETRGTKVDRDTLELWMKGMIRVYIQALKQFMDQAGMSILEVARMREEQAKAKRIDKLAEKLTGDDHDETHTEGGFETSRSRVKIDAEEINEAFG